MVLLAVKTEPQVNVLIWPAYEPTVYWKQRTVTTLVNIIIVVVYFQTREKKKKKPFDPRAVCHQSSQINVLYQFPPLQKCLWGWYDLAEGGTDHSPKQRDRLCVSDNDTKTNQREEMSSSLTFLPKSQKSTFEPCAWFTGEGKVFSVLASEVMSGNRVSAKRICCGKPATVCKRNTVKLVFLVLFPFHNFCMIIACENICGGASQTRAPSRTSRSQVDGKLNKNFTSWRQFLLNTLSRYIACTISVAAAYSRLS